LRVALRSSDFKRLLPRDIPATTPFRDLIADHSAAHLTDIHRQHADWQRHAARDPADGNIPDAMARYAAHGSVTDRTGRDAALADLVEDYVSDIELNGPDVSRLAFARQAPWVGLGFPNGTDSVQAIELLASSA